MDVTLLGSLKALSSGPTEEKFSHLHFSNKQRARRWAVLPAPLGKANSVQAEKGPITSPVLPPDSEVQKREHGQLLYGWVQHVAINCHSQEGNQDFLFMISVFFLHS